MVLKEKVLVILCLFAFVNASCQQKDYLNAKTNLSDLISLKDVPKDSLTFKIDKSEYKLSVLYKETLLKEYPVVFGGNPTDDKLMEGDQCTPEGSFKIISKYPHKSWSKFIWIDYPNKNSWKKHNRAKKEGKIPQEAKIGGEIGIHGVPGNTDFLINTKNNWTLGCISLKNADINEIYPYFNKSTIIEIQK
jgi:murein L,D-transpeptidase YafK